MSDKTAFLLAVLSGAIVGFVVGSVRAKRDPDEGGNFVPAWAISGGFTAALLFGALWGFHAVLYFLIGPLSPVSMLYVTIFFLILLGLGCLL